MKQLYVIATLFLLSAGTAAASWMGETWLWVRADKISPAESGSNSRKVTFKVLQWAKGAGHGDRYGRDFTGKTFTQTLRCKDPAVAAGINPGDTFWVKHRAVSCMVFDQDTGRRRGHSSSSWQHLGHALWISHPHAVQTLAAGDKGPASSSLASVFALRHSGNVTLKLRYATGGKYTVKFRLLKVGETRDSVTLTAVYQMTDNGSSWGTNQRKEDDAVLQFDASAFSGKTIHVLLNGKIVASL